MEEIETNDPTIVGLYGLISKVQASVGVMPYQLQLSENLYNVVMSDLDQAYAKMGIKMGKPPRIYGVKITKAKHLRHNVCMARFPKVKEMVEDVRSVEFNVLTGDYEGVSTLQWNGKYIEQMEVVMNLPDEYKDKTDNQHKPLE